MTASAVPTAAVRASGADRAGPVARDHGALGSVWPGRLTIDLLGHMRPADRLAVTVAGLDFPSRMGLGCGLDPGLRVISALARFGCGFLGLVVQGVGFIGAGLIISAIGATHVFVHEDLAVPRHDAQRRWRRGRQPRAARRARSRHARRDAARQRPGDPADGAVGLPAGRALAVVDAAASPACPGTPPLSASTTRSATRAPSTSRRRSAGWPSSWPRSRCRVARSAGR